MMSLHRKWGLIGFVLIAYISISGFLVEFLDMRALLLKYSAWHPDVQALHEHFYGPINYAVATPPDFTGEKLPAQLDKQAAIAKVAAIARAAYPGQPMRLIELRMAEGQPAGYVQMGSHYAIYSIATGMPLPARDLPPLWKDLNPPSFRQDVKGWHRFSPEFGGWGVIADAIGGIFLGVLIFTGLVQYFRVLGSRNQMGKRNPLWFAGGWWRSLHRWLSVTSAFFVAVIAITGILLSIDCVGQAIHYIVDAGDGQTHASHNADVSSPLQDAELAPMTQVTLASFAKSLPDAGIRVLRLRYFAGYAQGVVVADDDDTTQLVFNTKNGKTMLFTEPGYPDTGFPFGWQGHQWIKKIHRGDIFGFGGRWFMLFAAASMAYLSISGIKLYYDLWSRRKRNGKKALFW